ncbi:MAG: TetR/AcrR family transcriptional regulator [Chloroflexi bacterium]|nr:TetR/AcrR family transcriptional regulator [Chloroflexota bacterium]
MPILLEQSGYDLKREKVLEVAAQLFKEKGYRATSLRDIANALGVTKASLYHYFKSKEQILIELYERIHSRLAEAAQELLRPSGDATAALLEVIKNHIRFVTIHPDLSAIFFQEKAELDSQYRRVVNRRSREYDRPIEELIRQGIEEGRFRSVDVPVTVNLIMGMCNSVYQWYKPGRRLSADQIGELAAGLIIQGIGRGMNGDCEQKARRLKGRVARGLGTEVLEKQRGREDGGEARLPRGG